MLAPSFRLRLGERIYGPQVAALRLRRVRLPAVDRLEALLPAGVELDAAPGDEVELELDGGEGAETVFTGRITCLRRRLDSSVVAAQGPAELLARFRPQLSLEQVTAGDAIRRLAGDAGVSVGDVVAGPKLAIYAADGHATALAEIARLAAFSGAAARFDGSGRLDAPDPAQPGETLALKHGREILEAEAMQGGPDEAAPVVVGEGGDPDGEQARFVLADFLRGGAPPGDARRIALPEIRTRADADAAARALADARVARARAVRLTTFLIPALAPGLALQLADMPGQVDLARATVHQVVHEIGGDRAALSRIWGTGFVTGGVL